jgi:alpha-glucosidase (family GH31 glycosyl hydrolase)|mmetsp:Transcript_6459/g.8670  ORF Transcript_6459/g.8670 Transcript_6459/m.8670 type:complete len:122 (+) Transcript_6459:2352-2717(+)
MLGDSILVAPKITTPTEDLESKQSQEVTYLLPSGEKWYNYYTKAQEAASSPTQDMWVSKVLPDLEQAVFVKGGAVLPILQHEDCTALTKCVNNGIRMEVYLDHEGEASGSFYTDDGVSFEH